MKKSLVLALLIALTGCGLGFYDIPISEGDRAVKEVSLRGASRSDGTSAIAELSIVNASPLVWDVAVRCVWYKGTDRTIVGDAETSFTVSPWTRRYFSLSVYAPTFESVRFGRTVIRKPTPLTFADLRMRCEMKKERHVDV